MFVILLVLKHHAQKLSTFKHDTCHVTVYRKTHFANCLRVCCWRKNFHACTQFPCGSIVLFKRSICKSPMATLADAYVEIIELSLCSFPVCALWSAVHGTPCHIHSFSHTHDTLCTSSSWCSSWKPRDLWPGFYYTSHCPKLFNTASLLHQHFFHPLQLLWVQPSGFSSGRCGRASIPSW